MDSIKTILEKKDPSLEELIHCMELVRINGDVAVIKFDGERDNNFYTIFISYPSKSEKEMIRADISDLKKGLVEVLTEYMKLNN